MASIDLQTRRHATSAMERGWRLPSVMTLIALWRSRKALGELDTRHLDDVGLSRADALKEAERPVWDVPPSWRS